MPTITERNGASTNIEIQPSPDGFAHRHGDTRICGATTNVVRQDFVTIEGMLWAVHGDPNTHFNGGLIPSITYITIGGLRIIKNLDHANPDNLCPVVGEPHCDTFSVGYSDLVTMEVA